MALTSPGCAVRRSTFPNSAPDEAVAYAGLSMPTLANLRFPTTHIELFVLVLCITSFIFHGRGIPCHAVIN